MHCERKDNDLESRNRFYRLYVPQVVPLMVGSGRLGRSLWVTQRMSGWLGPTDVQSLSHVDGALFSLFSRC